MNKVSVGLFELPGLSFEKSLDPKKLEEMESWSKENHCGQRMTDKLWSFKNEQQRDWFILRWSESLSNL